MIAPWPWHRQVFGAVAAILLCAAAEGDPNPDATIQIEEVRVGFLFLGGSIGGGRLRYRGAKHAFTITGLGAGSLGVSTLQASGEVFGLDRLEDFPGTYVETQAAACLLYTSPSPRDLSTSRMPSSA